MKLQLKSLSVALLVVMVCLSTSTPWTDWNIPPTINMNSYPAAPGAGVGFNWARFTPYGSNRTNQYRWDLFATGNSTSKCSVFCGPRSFLTVDPNNPLNIVCQRDVNANYWGNSALLNEGTQYFKYCIPKTTSNCLGLPQMKNLVGGVCRPESYVNTFEDQEYDCCYNEVQGLLYHRQILDEVSFSVSSSPTVLRDSQ